MFIRKSFREIENEFWLSLPRDDPEFDEQIGEFVWDDAGGGICLWLALSEIFSLEIERFDRLAVRELRNRRGV